MRLCDCFTNLMAYVTYAVKNMNSLQPSYEQIHSDIQKLITDSEKIRSDNGFLEKDYDQARFAVFSWIDEMILRSGWRENEKWKLQKLQRRYYDTDNAGELFFERLNNIGPHQQNVREVYYICLALGFIGQFVNEGDDMLIRGLKTGNLQILTGSSVGVPRLNEETIFKDAYPDSFKQVEIDSDTRKLFSPLAIFFFIFPVAVYWIAFLLYRFILNSDLEKILQISTVG